MSRYKCVSCDDLFEETFDIGIKRYLLTYRSLVMDSMLINPQEQKVARN